MDAQCTPSRQQHMIRALNAADLSVRLQAALALGTQPEIECLDALVERCAVEPDFYVREMLTWAIIRLPSQSTMPRVLRELDSKINQARSQALHTLSKIGDKSAWPWITRSLLRDVDDEVARTAWRTAVALVPEADKQELAVELVSQLGRGNRDVQLSLSRALAELGDVIEEVLAKAAESGDPGVAEHAQATFVLWKNPEFSFEAALAEAKQLFLVTAQPVLADALTDETMTDG